jgi:hypothetical protein
MFYVLELDDCPILDDRFKMDLIRRLEKTEEIEKRTEIAPVYSEHECITRCYCKGSMRVPGLTEPIDVEFEYNPHGDCNLRVRMDQVNEADIEKVAEYFEARRVFESDV